jgi:hypothetical protein
LIFGPTQIQGWLLGAFSFRFKCLSRSPIRPSIMPRLAGTALQYRMSTLQYHDPAARFGAILIDPR